MTKQEISIHNSCTTTCSHIKECYYLKRKDNKPKTKHMKKIVDELYYFHTNIDKNTTFDLYNAATPKKNEILDLFKLIKERMNIDLYTYNVTNWGSTMPLYAIKEFREGLELIKDHPEYNRIFTHFSFSCYTEDDIRNNQDINKLFLIKNTNTYKIACNAIINKCKNIHYPIDLDWAENNKKDLLTFIKLFNTNKIENTSLDSCLMNVLTNKKCTNIDTYIDVDANSGGIRRCPFSTTPDYYLNNHDSKLTTKKLLTKLFEVKHKPSCFWVKEFGDKL